MTDWNKESYSWELRIIRSEVVRADDNHPLGFVSELQMIMVIKEEMEEVWESIIAGNPDSCEIAQVAATSLRALRDLWKVDIDLFLMEIFSGSKSTVPGVDPNHRCVSYKEMFGKMSILYERMWSSINGLNTAYDVGSYLEYMVIQCLVSLNPCNVERPVN